MNSPLDCPYCGQPKHNGLPMQFRDCRFCGFKSAMVKSGGGTLLIVDRRMPFLKERCQEIKDGFPDITVIVDRRIAQDPFDREDRRMSTPEEQPA